MMDCPHENTIKQDGIYITCMDCGEVLETDNFENNAPRHYSSEDDVKIHHAPFDKFVQRGSLMIVPGNSISKDYNSKYARLNKQDGWKVYNINKKAQEVKIMVASFLHSFDLATDNIIKTVNYYILKTNNINLQGCSLDSYCSALIIYTFRECEVPFGIKNILDYFNAKFSPTSRLLRILIEEYNLKNYPPLHLNNYVTYYITKICYMYKYDDEKMVVKLQSDAIKCVKKVSKSNKCRGNKLCITAGIIYFIFKKNKISVPQNVISNAINITTVSLRSTYMIIKDL